MSMQLATNGRRVFALASAVIVVGVFLLGTGVVPILTPDQQAWREYERGEYEQAAEHFSDPMWAGVALFKQSEFERSGGVFAGFDTADSAFNQGNALVMQGKYTEAAGRYARALELRPEWSDAIINRDIALGRAERLKQEGGDMTGGMLGADDIVFTTGKSPSAEEEQTDGEQKMSDEEIRAVWLRQVQTKPADFLAAKFAYQHAMRPTADNQQQVPQ